MPRPLFTPGKDPGPIVQEAEWATGPVWTGAENLAPTGIRSPDRPGRSQSLYRLRYQALFGLHSCYSHTFQIPQYETRQTMYVQCNGRALSCINCSRGKAISITYSEFVSIIFVIQHAKGTAILHYHLWSLWSYHIFPCYLIKGTSFGNKLLNVKCVFRLYQQIFLNISHSKKNSLRYYHKCT